MVFSDLLPALMQERVCANISRPQVLKELTCQKEVLISNYLVLEFT
jgi:hypothetical protein